MLGYRTTLTENAFKFAGAPAQVQVPSLANPIEDKSFAEIEAFVGYARRIGHKLEWRGQINVRNLLDNRDPIGQRANPVTGATAVYTVPEPRSFVFKNTFSF